MSTENANFCSKKTKNVLTNRRSNIIMDTHWLERMFEFFLEKSKVLKETVKPYQGRAVKP